MKGAELFVQCLEEEGVKRIYALPGEENLAFLDALRTSSIDVIICRHEQSAGFMAATEGRLTGRPGVCLSTLGPGACNLVTAAAYATLGGMPMLMITAQKPVRSAQQGAFQHLDVRAMFQPLTKFAKQLASTQLIPCHVRQAFRAAQGRRPGAVHLELPEDIAAEDCTASPIRPTQVAASVAPIEAIERAVDLLHHAKHPMLLVGSGASRSDVGDELRAFVRDFGLPFASTQMGKGVLDETSEGFLGCAALSEGDLVHQALRKADLLLCIGHDVVEKPPFDMGPQAMRIPKVIHVGACPAEIAPVYTPCHEVVGDLRESLRRFRERVRHQEHWDFRDQLALGKMLREELRAEDDQPSGESSVELGLAELVALLAQELGGRVRLSLDNGLYKVWFARNWLASQPNEVLLDNALATMGAGVPAAIASTLVEPGTRVLAICGDGGFLMNSQEIETAARLKLHLVVLVLRDDSYGMIQWKQKKDGYDSFGLDVGPMDYAGCAAAHGAIGHRADSADALREVLAGALSEPAVHVIETRINYSVGTRLPGDRDSLGLGAQP